MAMNLGPSIKTAYFYVFSAVGVILMIVGVFKLSDFAVRSFLLDNYYLDYETGRCSYLEPVKVEGQPAVDNAVALESCKKDLERERQVKKVTDMASAITFTVVGAALFVFHYRRARKLS